MKRLTPTNEILVVADEVTQMKALERSLRTFAPYRLQIVDQADFPDELSGFDAVLVYVHAPLRDSVTPRLISYAGGGGRLIVLHHGLASSKRANPAWLEFLGVEIGEAEAPHLPWRVVSRVTHAVVNLKPGHFITTDGVEYPDGTEYVSSDSPSGRAVYPSFNLPDTEVFLNQRFTDGRAKTVLFGSKYHDPKTGEECMQDRAGWVKRTGRGTTIYLQPGHSGSDFENPVFSRIIHNAIVWDTIETMLPSYAVGSGARRSFHEQDPFGWRDLTPDRALTGWTEYDWPPGSPKSDAGQSAQWTMDEASGVLRTPGRPHTHLLSQSVFSDFVLHVEWRYIPGEGTQNSGVFVRMIPGARVMHQIECLKGREGIVMGGRLQEGVLYPVSAIVPGAEGSWEPVPNHTSNGWTPEIRRVADVDPMRIPDELVPSRPVEVNPPGEWNVYEILCVGPRITVWTNGCASSHTECCTVPAGSIGFEAEGHAVEFRNILLKPM